MNVPAVALHEAAHATVAVRLGIPLLRVVVASGSGETFPGDEMNPEAGGYTLTGTSSRVVGLLSDPANRSLLEAVAAQMAAGPVADLLLGVSGHTDPGDMQRVRRLARDLGIAPGGEEAAFADTAWNRARVELERAGRRPWFAVAYELWRTKQMTGDEVRAVIERTDAGGTTP